MSECYGLIDRGIHQYYTYMSKVFAAIGNAQNGYNWLITGCEACPHYPDIEEMLAADYCWLTGEELSALIEREDFQWIWAVLSGFDKSIPLSEILEYPLPEVHDSTSIQHPLATVEILPFDSSYTMILSRKRAIIDQYREAYPQTEVLTTSGK